MTPTTTIKTMDGTHRASSAYELNSASRHIAVIASMRFSIRQPFAGGMEAQTHDLVEGLRKRNHRISVHDGTDEMAGFQVSETARADVSTAPEMVVREHHAHLDLMLDLATDDRYDLIHANSVHHLPLAMASILRIPFTMTLHSPPTPWLESAVALDAARRRNGHFVAVSRHVAEAWKHTGAHMTVIPNGVDTSHWTAGAGDGGYVVWSGRIVPEKAPHLAIDAARGARRKIFLAGPIHHPEYFQSVLAPRLGPDAVWAGHLARTELSRLVGAAEVAIVSPDWDEPYGLVAAEALATGTPVACFARGGLTEFVTEEVGALARPGDVDSLTKAVARAARRNRHVVRTHAVDHCSLDSMVDAYVDWFGEVIGE